MNFIQFAQTGTDFLSSYSLRPLRDAIFLLYLLNLFWKLREKQITFTVN